MTSDAQDDKEEEEPRLPIGDVLQGLDIHALLEGERAIEAFVLLKVEDGDGETHWSFRTSRRPNHEELLGALMIQVDLLRRSLISAWDVG